MKHRSVFFMLFVCVLLSPVLLAKEQVSKTDEPDAKSVLAGHSYHGEAFDEGPRQEAYLMRGTGNVRFPVTTKSPLAQKFFNQGIGQLHGFWYFEAERSFRQVLMIDPQCVMAYWGMIMANKNNKKRADLFVKKMIALKEKLASKEKTKLTDREVMYIDALKKFQDSGAKERRTSGKDFAAAFAAIAKKYPNDLEAKAFQGLYLYHTIRSVKKDAYEVTDKLLWSVLAVNPSHPCHHYLIHLWDYKKPARALKSAAACGKSAAGVAHMWHMPGHIYSRLKRYRDAVWQQEASARIDHAHMMRDQVLPDQIHNFAHNNEWLIRNLIYVGRMRDALDLARNMCDLPRHPKYNQLSGKLHSARYGRMRLTQILTTYELWDEIIALSQTWYLGADDDTIETSRLRLLARAYFKTQQIAKGKSILAQFEKQLVILEKNEAKLKKNQAKKKGFPVIALKPRKISQNSPARKAALKRSRAIRDLKNAINELKGRVAIAAGKFADGLKLVKKGGGSDPLEIIRVRLKAGETTAVVKELKTLIKRRKNELLLLAHLVEALWKANKKKEATTAFNELRLLAGKADLDAPALQRLAGIAKALKWPADWRTVSPIAKDFGKRPTLDSLGPFRWEPSKAVDWSLKDVHGKTHSLADYRGKRVVLIFYLGHGCLHCAEQLEAFAPKVKAFADAGISLIAISTDTLEDLKQSHANYQEGTFPFPLVADANLDIFHKYRVYDDFEKQPLHGTFVIDEHGKIRWHDISYEPFMEPDFVLKEANRLFSQSEIRLPPRLKPSRLKVAKSVKSLK